MNYICMKYIDQSSPNALVKKRMTIEATPFAPITHRWRVTLESGWFTDRSPLEYKRLMSFDQAVEMARQLVEKYGLKLEMAS